MDTIFFNNYIFLLFTFIITSIFKWWYMRFLANFYILSNLIILWYLSNYLIHSSISVVIELLISLYNNENKRKSIKIFIFLHFLRDIVYNTCINNLIFIYSNYILVIIRIKKIKQTHYYLENITYYSHISHFSKQHFLFFIYCSKILMPDLA